VIILNPEEPSEDVKIIIDDPMYINRVQYVRGSALDSRSLEKVRIHEAKACFIFSSKYAGSTRDVSDEDAQTVMRALVCARDGAGMILGASQVCPQYATARPSVAPRAQVPLRLSGFDL
jgi:hypothetical protein